MTVTARGLRNALSSVVDCGVLPAASMTLNPWLWKAPMSGLGESGSPRSSDVIPLTTVPSPMEGYREQDGHGLGSPSVVPQSGEYGIGNANGVAILSVHQSC